MNLKELRQLLDFVDKTVNGEDVKLCISDFRDGFESFQTAEAFLTKTKSGDVILVVRYDRW